MMHLFLYPTFCLGREVKSNLCVLLFSAQVIEHTMLKVFEIQKRSYSPNSRVGIFFIACIHIFEGGIFDSTLHLLLSQ